LRLTLKMGTAQNKRGVRGAPGCPSLLLLGPEVVSGTPHQLGSPGRGSLAPQPLCTQG